MEEFVGVVHKYGASSEVARILEAAKGVPEASDVSISKSTSMT